MAFVKLDCGILDSTIWLARDARDVFMTALLMATPHELRKSESQLHVRQIKPTGWKVPKGWYGFVPAAGIGIVRRAGLPDEKGLDALEVLCKPESESRSPEFSGRRMARVSGGYVILNYIKYRERDHSGAERAKRYRQRSTARSQVSAFAKQWETIVAFYGGMCAYCERRQWTEIDHIMPTSKGGKHEASNVAPACKSCNSSKKADTTIKPARKHPYISD